MKYGMEINNKNKSLCFYVFLSFNILNFNDQINLTQNNDYPDTKTWQVKVCHISPQKCNFKF